MEQTPCVWMEFAADVNIQGDVSRAGESLNFGFLRFLESDSLTPCKIWGSDSSYFNNISRFLLCW